MTESVIPGEKLPKHIAIIMDGNGRWARKRGYLRMEGHRRGMGKIRKVVQMCSDEGVNVLTLYAFSQQNWNRPQREVEFLMKRFEQYLEEEEEDLQENSICLRIIGRRDNLPASLTRKIEQVTSSTAKNTRFFLNLAINYGGQEEIIDGVRSVASLVREGKISPGEINEDFFKQHLYMPDLPYPDLLIRTGGEYRVSNFLLWHIAYTELWITDTLWPDFNRTHLRQALRDFADRDRRFGSIKE